MNNLNPINNNKGLVGVNFVQELYIQYSADFNLMHAKHIPEKNLNFQQPRIFK